MMFGLLKKTTKMAAIAAALLVANNAHASYFIRPYVSLGAGVVDGYDQDGATQGSASFTNALRSSVDLATGTTKNYLKITGPDAGGSGNGQSAGIFGDRVHFLGGQGSTANFSFNFDGTIVAPARPNVNSTMQIGVYATLRVFDPGAGADYMNFNTLPGALISRTVFLDFSNPSVPLNELVQQSLADSLTIAGNGIYDVFGSLSIFAALNDNAATIEMDFLHTGTFGIQTDPGVSFTSDSGVFLAGQGGGAVPEPGAWAMMLLGLGIIGGSMRRRAAIGALVTV
jgi:hypothetical protein